MTDDLSRHDLERAAELLRCTESLEQAAPVLSACSVTGGELRRIVTQALYWYGYWTSPPTHIHREIQTELSSLRSRNVVLCGEVERLERENAALRLELNRPREAKVETKS
jgi:hypothetical protein